MGLRKHAEAKIGDHFGVLKVTRLLPRDATKNERVAWECTVCGKNGSTYVSNLRTSARLEEHRVSMGGAACGHFRPGKAS